MFNLSVGNTSHSAGSCIDAVDAVLNKTVRNAYCLVRPPGHHAEAGRGRGFCIFNNVALAALHAIEERGLKRVAIVDYDVHHGNGTEQGKCNQWCTICSCALGWGSDLNEDRLIRMHCDFLSFSILRARRRSVHLYPPASPLPGGQRGQRMLQ